MTRTTRPNVTPPVAALAAMSVALLLCMPAGASGVGTVRPAEAHRHAAHRDAFASLIETLNDAARSLAGVDDKLHQTHPPHADPAQRAAWSLQVFLADPSGRTDLTPPRTIPVRDALLNLPPPTR